jgi:hypothetical protein
VVQLLVMEDINPSLRVVDMGGFAVSTDRPVSFLDPSIIPLQRQQFRVMTTPVGDEWENPACFKFDLARNARNGVYNNGVWLLLGTRSGAWFVESFSDGSLLLSSDDFFTARVAGCFVAPGKFVFTGLSAT